MADTDKPAQAENKEDDLPGNSNGINRDIVYYYSREHRLNMSSPIVQGMYEKKSTRPGLSFSLFGSRPNLMLFVSIILICIMFGIASRAAGSRVIKLGGNTVDMVILREEGPQILKITKKAPASGETYLGQVDIAVSAAHPKQDADEEALPAFTHRIEFKPFVTETFRVSLPFDEDDFFVVLKTSDEQKSMRVKTTGKKGK